MIGEFFLKVRYARFVLDEDGFDLEVGCSEGV